MTLLSILVTLGSAIGNAADNADITGSIATFNQHAVFGLPTLSADDLADLQRGEVIKRLLPNQNGNLQVVGMMVSKLPMQQVWLASQDPHFMSPGSATEARLSVQGDKAVWYGFLDLPMPFSDRHWVVDSWNNHTLAQVTDNQMWEHPWTLDDDGLPLARPTVEAGAVAGLTLRTFERAIFTPVNHGALVFIGLNEGETLLSYHATSVIGGNIPERLAAEFIRSGLDKLLRRIDRIAREEVRSHYTARHPVLLGGDGQPVPHY
ncbi:MAG: hypothetical protein AAFV53_00690 [Myxococcota bacterium]